MSVRATGLALELTALLTLGLLLGVLFGRAELIVAVVPAGLALLSRRQASRSQIEIDHVVSDDKVLEGGRIRVTVVVTAHDAPALLEVEARLPSLLQLVSGHNRAVIALSAGEEKRWSYELFCLASGRFELGHLLVRLLNDGTVSEEQDWYRKPAFVRVYPSFVALGRLPRPARTQNSLGNYPSRQMGEGLEPGEVRAFASGDRIRHINWKASLRAASLIVNQFQVERNADVVVLVDATAESGARPYSSRDFCLRAAASLAAGYLARRDRVGFVEFGGLIRWIRPGSGRLQYERILDALLSTDVIFTDLARDLSFVPPRVLPAHALVIAVTPLLDRHFTEVMMDLVGRGFDVVVLAVSPVELTRRVVPRSAVGDLAARIWRLERAAQLGELRRSGLSVVEWDPREPLNIPLSGLSRGPHRRARAS